MSWQMSTVRDISHHNTISDYPAFRANASDVQIKITESTTFIDSAGLVHHRGCNGMRRAPYHFARPVSLSEQISHYLKIKRDIGPWERPDMLDCEFSGITGAFIRELVAEYRRQSGIQKVQVYIGLHDIVTTCPPSQWWDDSIYIQVARYRKIGPPLDPNNWRNHLGFDHPGLSTYQWDNANPFYRGGPAGDVSFDRVFVGKQGDEMELSTTGVIKYPYKETGETMEVGEALGFSTYITADMAKDDDGMAVPSVRDGSNRLSIPALRDDIDALNAKVDQILNLFTHLVGNGQKLVSSGEITIKATPFPTE